MNVLALAAQTGQIVHDRSGNLRRARRPSAGGGHHGHDRAEDQPEYVVVLVAGAVEARRVHAHAERRLQPLREPSAEGLLLLATDQERPRLPQQQRAQFPGFTNTGDQTSFRPLDPSASDRRCRRSLVNEVKGGWQWSPVDFYSAQTPDPFDLTGGYAVTLGFGLTNAHVVNAPNTRNTPTWNIENTLSWLKGSHSLSFGGAFTQVTADSDAWSTAPTITMGVNEANDPANGLFTTANFPGASNANLTSARELYALLTGRVTE